MYLFFDTETTGLPAKGQYANPNHPQTPKLVELAAVLYNKEHEKVAHQNVLIKPYYPEPIHPKALEAHGITKEQAASEGVDLIDAVTTFLHICKEADILLAHNFQYDYLVLSRAFIDAKFGSRADLPKVGKCTKELATPICRIPKPWGKEYKWPTLQEAHKHFFGVEFDGAHSALADVEACARIFFHMKTKGLIR